MKIIMSKSQWEWESINERAQFSKSEQEPNIAKTILQQLGGNKFISTTGAKNFTNIPNGLSFKIAITGAGITKQNINYIKIIMNSSNTYTMEFGITRITEYKIINTIKDVHAEQLQKIFTRETGLETHL